MKKQQFAAGALLGLTALALAGCGGGGKTVKENGGGTDPTLSFRVVYTRGGDIWRMNGDGSNVQQLTRTTGFDFQPTLSPDRQWIVFTSDQAATYAKQYRLFLMRNDGTQLEQLTESTGFEADPAFSPDGTQVAFVSNRHGNDELYVMTVNSGVVRRLTNTAAAEQTPAWSPDGTRLVFAATPSSTENTDIYSIRASDGGDAVRLTTNVATDDSPSFSPDGRWVAFASDREGGKFRIFQVRTDGSGDLQSLTNGGGGGEDGFPVYTTDGNYLLFDSDRDVDSDIYRLNLNTGQTIRLSTSYDPETNPDTRVHKVGQRRHGKR